MKFEVYTDTIIVAQYQFSLCRFTLHSSKIISDLSRDEQPLDHPSCHFSFRLSSKINPLATFFFKEVVIN